MTDQLKKSIEQLRTMTPKLNAATDEANKTVAAVEKFLNEECSIGISAYVNAWRGDSGSLRLAFDRIGGKFRIAVVDQKWIDDPQYPGNGSWQDAEVLAWAESPRAWKLRTFPAVPALLEKIASEAEDAMKRIDQTQTAVQEIMGAMGKPSINVPIPASNVAKGEMTTAKILFGESAHRKGIRVNQLAQELGIPSKSILERIKAEGFGDQAPNHMSLMSLGLAASVREWFAPIETSPNSRGSESDK